MDAKSWIEFYQKKENNLTEEKIKKISSCELLNDYASLFIEFGADAYKKPDVTRIFNELVRRLRPKQGRTSL